MSKIRNCEIVTVFNRNITILSLKKTLLFQYSCHVEMIVFRVSGFIMDPVISTFPKILYTSDVMDALKVSL